MSYFAAAVVRDRAGWSAAEVSLADAADVEDVADRLRDVGADRGRLAALRGVRRRVPGHPPPGPGRGPAGVRLGRGLRRGVAAGRAAARRCGRAVGRAGRRRGRACRAGPGRRRRGEADAEADEPLAWCRPVGDRSADADPAGDPDLLADLGVPAIKLLELCAQEGMLPSDITAELCQAIGAGDEVEELREA